MTAEYRPGVCNIGRAEQRLRYGFAAIAFLAAGALVLGVGLSVIPESALLLAVAPLFGGFVSYYQGREAFCVGYAVAGIYNVTDRVGEHGEVSDSESKRLDRRHALSLLARSAVLAVGVTILLYLIVPT